MKDGIRMISKSHNVIPAEKNVQESTMSQKDISAAKAIASKPGTQRNAKKDDDSSLDDKTS